MDLAVTLCVRCKAPIVSGFDTEASIGDPFGPLHGGACPTLESRAKDIVILNHAIINEKAAAIGWKAVAKRMETERDSALAELTRRL